MSFAYRSTHATGHRADVLTGIFDRIRAVIDRFAGRARVAIDTLAARALAMARQPLSAQHVFAVVFVVAVLLYLFVLLVQPTGAGRGGR